MEPLFFPSSHQVEASPAPPHSRDNPAFRMGYPSTLALVRSPMASVKDALWNTRFCLGSGVEWMVLSCDDAWDAIW